MICGVSHYMMFAYFAFTYVYQLRPGLRQVCGLVDLFLQLRPTLVGERIGCRGYNYMMFACVHLRMSINYALV
jgi:hypothetical protein